MPYAILLEELKPLDLQKTARILAKAEDIVYADATRSVRYCCGILAQDLRLDEARSISEELNREGVGVFYMEQSEMYRPEQAVHIHNADCLEESFRVEDLYGREHPLAWANVILMSVGRVVERKDSGGMASGGSMTEVIGHTAAKLMGLRRPGASSRREAPRKVWSEEHLILDIFSREPDKRHYRIEHDKFNYDYLGSKLKQSAPENFQFLVEDVARFANQAYGNRGINAYLSGKEPGKMDYENLEFFDRENLWLLQLIHLRSSPSEEEE